MKIFIVFAVLAALTLPVIAQDVEVGQEEAEPEQVIKVEELIIELEPLKVFTIPHMDGDLPPVDFTGIFRREHLIPDFKLFLLDEADLAVVPVKDFSNLLAKKRN